MKHEEHRFCYMWISSAPSHKKPWVSEYIHVIGIFLGNPLQIFSHGILAIDNRDYVYTVTIIYG